MSLKFQVTGCPLPASGLFAAAARLAAGAFAVGPLAAADLAGVLIDFRAAFPATLFFASFFFAAFIPFSMRMRLLGLAALDPTYRVIS